MAVEAKLTPCGAQSDRIVSEIEEGEVLGVPAIARLANGSAPDAGILKTGAKGRNVYRMAVGGSLIDENNGLIRIVTRINSKYKTKE